MFSIIAHYRPIKTSQPQSVSDPDQYRQNPVADVYYSIYITLSAPQIGSLKDIIDRIWGLIMFM